MSKYHLSSMCLTSKRPRSKLVLFLISSAYSSFSFFFSSAFSPFLSLPDVSFAFFTSCFVESATANLIAPALSGNAKTNRPINSLLLVFMLFIGVHCYGPACKRQRRRHGP